MPVTFARKRLPWSAALYVAALAAALGSSGAAAEGLVAGFTGQPSEPVGVLEKAGVRQVLWVTTSGWQVAQGRAQRYQRATLAAPFQAVGPAMAAWLGRAGLAWRSDVDAPPPPVRGARKREGDGCSPAGVLPLGAAWGYQATPPSGILLPYHQAGPRDRCIDDATDAQYTQLVRAPLTGTSSWRSAESLLLPSDHYKYLIVVDYNMRRPRAGAGSCIFVHVAPPPGEPTVGCTALAEADLLAVLRWLDPAQHPVLVQLPAPAEAAARTAWHLPPELGAVKR